MPNAKVRGITEAKITLRAMLVNNVTGTQVYLVFPSLYTCKQKALAMRETGRVALALRKEEGRAGKGLVTRSK